jgi:hypothetical protein
MVTAQHSSPPAADAATDPVAVPTRVRVVAVALSAAATSVAVLVATHPWGERLDSSAEDVLSYDALRLVDRDAAWAGLLVTGFALAVVAVCAALATCLLARGRGRGAALLGSVLTVAGGVLFAMGSSTFAAVTWFATSEDMSEDGGRRLVDVANEAPGHLLGLEMGGFLLVTLGGLTLAAALLRARAVPLVAVVAFVVLTLALFAPLPPNGTDAVQVLQMVVVAALAIPVWRQSQRRPVAPQ